MRDEIDETEQELVELLERAEPTLLRRALAHVAGRLAEAEGVPTARRMTQIVDQALERISAPLAS
jgi:hypothetical protein